MPKGRSGNNGNYRVISNGVYDDHLPRLDTIHVVEEPRNRFRYEL